MRVNNSAIAAIIMLVILVGFYAVRKYPLICANSVAVIAVLGSLASGWILQRAIKGKGTARQPDQPPMWYEGRVRLSDTVAALVYGFSALLLLIVIAGHVNGFGNDSMEKVIVTAMFFLAPIAWLRNESQCFNLWVRKCDAERQKFEREHFKKSWNYIKVCWGATAALFAVLLIKH